VQLRALAHDISGWHAPMDGQPHFWNLVMSTLSTFTDLRTADEVFILNPARPGLATRPLVRIDVFVARLAMKNPRSGTELVSRVLDDLYRVWLDHFVDFSHAVSVGRLVTNRAAVGRSW